MNTRLKFLALACAAPLALAACEQQATDEAQVGQAEEPAVQEPMGEEQVAEEPGAEQEAAGVTDEAEETQAAQMPEETAEQPPAGEDTQAAGDPAAGDPAAGDAQSEQDFAQAEQQDMQAAPAGQAPVDFIGNWAMQGEGCPGEWEFTEQTVEVPQQGSFQVDNIQESGQEVELEVTSMEGEQTQTLALSFPEEQQDTMVVTNAGDEVTLERCQ